ncbi:MAG TPA: hypothetical protein VGH33_17835 [Isosphaeraceae bacterium]|jgi:hypothetical protein
MKSRLSRLGVLTAAACLGLLGCEHWRNGLRKDGDDPSAKKMTDMDESALRAEHAAGTKTGAWSSQAREIESHFNVGQ